MSGLPISLSLSLSLIFLTRSFFLRETTAVEWVDFLFTQVAFSLPSLATLKLDPI